MWRRRQNCVSIEKRTHSRDTRRNYKANDFWYESRLTWLEDECSTNINIPAVTGGLDALIGSKEGAYNECGGLANGIKGPKLDAHVSQKARQ